MDGHLGYFQFLTITNKAAKKKPQYWSFLKMHFFLFFLDNTQNYNCWVIFTLSFVKKTAQQFHEAVIRHGILRSDARESYEETLLSPALSIVRLSSTVHMQWSLIVVLTCISLEMKVLAFAYTSNILFCEVFIQTFVH